MAAFLLTWNPDVWPWPELAAELADFRRGGALVRRWSCGKSKSLNSGDRVFFLKQGTQGRGLFASGYVEGSVFEDTHFADCAKKSRYVTVSYDVLLDPSTDLLPREQLDVEPLSRVHWATQGGGMEIRTEAIEALESLWRAHVRSQGLNPVPVVFADDGERVYLEGASRPITVRALERSSAARDACIATKGTACVVCELDFGDVYGEIGAGFIHVHHTAPLGSSTGTRRTNPVTDLEPVCPNCHSMLHRRTPPLTVAELRSRMRREM